MVFDVADHPTNERSAIALDLYFNALVYANNQGLSLEKTSCLLGIFKATHEKSMAERMTTEKVSVSSSCWPCRAACIGHLTASAS